MKSRPFLWSTRIKITREIKSTKARFMNWSKRADRLNTNKHPCVVTADVICHMILRYFLFLRQCRYSSLGSQHRMHNSIWGRKWYFSFGNLTIPYPPEHISIANIWECPTPGDNSPPPSRCSVCRPGYWQEYILIHQLYHFNATCVQTHLDLLEYQNAVTMWWREHAIGCLTGVWQRTTAIHFWFSNPLRQRIVSAD